MESMKRRAALLRTSFLTGVVSLAIAAPVMAQDATPQEETAAPADAPARQDPQTPSTTEVGEVVVTGSRIARSEFSSASPIQVITKEVSTQAGLLSTAEIIQGSTVAGGSQQLNSLFSGFVTDGGPGIQSVSLRGLGANRTLVMLNGRRLAPAGAGGTVGAGADLNVIPSGVLQRVEILKDGASSVYGSDAVAGVVNAITTTNFNGLEIGAYQSLPEHGGGERSSIDLTWGKQFDRGNFLIGLEYQEQRKLLYKDRDWADCGYDNVRDPVTGANLDFTNADGSPKCVSGTWHGFYQTAFGYLGLDPSGRGLVDFGGNIPGFPGVVGFDDLTVDQYGTGGVDETSYEGPFDDERSLVFPTRRLTATAFFNHDINALGGAEFYSEFLYNNRTSTQVTAGQFFPTIGYDDPRNPISGILDTYFGPGFESFADMIAVAPIRYVDKQDVDYVRAVAGLRGDLSVGPMKNWNWDLSYMFSGSYADYSGNRLLADRVANALDVVSDGAGGYVCANAAARSAGCVPLPVFDQRFLMNGQLTDAERDYVYTQENGTTEFTSHLVSGSLTGDLFQLPAGTLAAAIGFEFRADSIDDQPGLNAQAGNVYGYSSASATVGDEKVYEVFGELEAPLLSKMRFVEDLTLSTSARYTKYEETGYEDSTYKVGLNWTIDPTFRIRSTFGTSFRAPALYELFLAGQSSFYSGSDPCTNFQTRDPSSNLFINCSAEIGAYPGAPTPAFTGWNSTPKVVTYGAQNRPSSGLFSGNLEAETSEALTLGVIWTPSFMPLSVAIDYFDITVDGEIAALGAGSILSQCYNEEPDEFRTTGTLCDLISQRTPYNYTTGAGGDIAQVDTSYFNINSQRTVGFDITTRFTHEFSFGDFSFDTRTTVTTIDEVDVFGTGKNNFNKTFSDPEVVSELDFQLQRGDWRFFWRSSFVSSQSNYKFYARPNNDPSTSIYDIQIDAQWLHTASVTYEGNQWEATVGVSNLFDEEPDSISSAFTRIGNAGFTSQMEPYGRTLFVSLRKSFQ